MTLKRPEKKEQMTWLCACGTFNLLQESKCEKCDGDRKDHWGDEEKTMNQKEQHDSVND